MTNEKTIRGANFAGFQPARGQRRVSCSCGSVDA
jgi:hypothetical protein